MKTSSTHTKPGRSLAVLSSIITAGAVLAANPVFAAKPLPTLEYVADTFTCALGGTTGATFSVTGGKGRWTIVTTYVSVNGGAPSAVGLVGARVELGSTFTPDVPTELGWQTVQWTAEIVDRNDGLQGESASSEVGTCS